MSNILILSCGTRKLLVSYFKQRINGFEKVVVTDCSVYAPALYCADKYYIVPKMTDSNYLSDILTICNEEKINAVLPLQEDELVLIAKNKELFLSNNIIPIISDANIISVCRDKYKFYMDMCDLSINSIPTFLMDELGEIRKKYDLPLFMKPRFGAGSVSNYKINTQEMIEAISNSEEGEFVLQPYCEGVEYGINVYVDMISKEVVEIFILKKIRMRAGETEKSVSVKNTEIERIVNDICSKMNFIGPVDIDLIEKDGKYYVLEINPRFGGAYPHAHSCGVNFVKLIANNIDGKVNNPFEMAYEEGVIALRYTDVFIVKRDEIING